MKIGGMVGKLADGTIEYLGKPGEISVLKKLQRKMNAAYDGKYVKTWVQNMAGVGCVAKKVPASLPVKDIVEVLADLRKKDLVAIAKGLDLDGKGNKDVLVAAIEAARAALADAETDTEVEE